MSNNQLRFDGKVVIVTGAGGGLGKAYALAFAERGAFVVVNDLGGDIKGGGKNSKAADLVVEEIKRNKGVAVANYDSVENAESIVKTAIDNFGRIDILINNAGILRDKSLLRTSDEDWDIIHRIHLRSSFLLLRTAWPHMQKNGFGRVIMTSSAAGIYGNYGQSNYSAAKLGALGLCNTASIEGAKYNIKCNTIAPLAKSRLTQTVMPDDILDSLKPEYVAPLVLYLCHDSCEETGSVFEVGGGWVGKLRWQKSSGKLFPIGENQFQPEDVRDNWNEITSFEKPIYPKTISESTTLVLDLIEKSKTGNTNEQAESKQNKNESFSYNQKDAILYALSINFSTTDCLKFLYENHPDFSVFPTYGVIPGMANLFNTLSNYEFPKGVTMDLSRLLHGEQYLELYKQFSPSDVLHSVISVVDVLDKGSGATVIVNAELFNEKNEIICLNQFVIFLVGCGNFGGKRDSNKLYAVNTKKLSRSPDQIIREKTHIDQAALYRLNGDFNPLHIDPQFASMGGFDKPILHGLCSFGIAVKHVLKTYCDNDVTCFKAVKGRFAKPVIPGQSVETSMWLEKEHDGFIVYFECKVVETGSVCISGGYVKLSKVNANMPENQSNNVVNKTDTKFASAKVFDELSKKLTQNPEIGNKIKAIYVFSIKKGKDEVKSWTVDLKNNKISEGEAKDGLKADCTITLEDDDFVLLSEGKLNAQKMFMQGKLSVKGNIMMAQKLSTLFKESSKL